MKRLLPLSALFLFAFTGAYAQSLGPVNAGPTMLTGKVAMQDGSPPPEGVNIVEVCSGRPRIVTFTDRKGGFAFQVGQRDRLALPDLSDAVGGAANGGLASVGPRGGGAYGPAGSGSVGSSSGPAGLPLAGCDLRADLPGYKSSSISLAGHLSSDNPAVGTILLTRLANVEGVSVSATSAKVPANAQKSYEQGMDSLRKGKPADAEKDFEKAVGIYPQYAGAWLALAKLRMQRKAADPAREAFQKALDADDKLVEARVQLGMMAAQQGQWADAVKYLDPGLQLDPVDYPHAWFFDAMSYFNMKDYVNAEKGAREAVKLDPKHTNPDADRLLGLILATKGDYSEAATELKIFIDLAPPETNNLPQVKAQLAEIERLAKSQP